MTPFLIVFVVGVQLAFATKLPAYIEKCSQSDPKFVECILRNANKAIKHVLPGDLEFGLPKLVPVKLEPMHLDVTKSVQFILTNGIGIIEDDVTMTAVEFDFKQKSMFLSMKISRATWYVDYEATGKIQDKPLHEKGKANITFDELVVNSTVNLNIKTVQDKKYLEATASDANTFSANFDFKPYNKERTGQQLSDAQVQEIAALYKQSGLKIRQEAKQLADTVILLELNSILKLAPFDDIFLP